MTEEDKIRQAAQVAHEANRAYCRSIGDFSQPEWSQAPAWQVGSAVAGIRSLLARPDTTPEENHNRWMERKLSEGWVFGPTKNVDAKQHPCIVAWEHLDEPNRIKNRLFIGIVKAVLDLD